MTPSPPRLPLLVEVLCAADAAYELICDIEKMAAEGRQADALATLAYLADAVQAHRPILRGVIAAQRQAADARDLTQRPDVRVICSIGQAVKQPDPANPEQSPTPDTTQPAA